MAGLGSTRLKTTMVVGGGEDRAKGGQGGREVECG